MCGNKDDYDNWDKLGCSGWSYNAVLPIFKKLEKNTSLANNSKHGTTGEINVATPQDANPLVDLFIEAGKQFGLPVNTDFNSGKQFGLGVYQVQQKNGIRVSSYSAFVAPIKNLDNLTIMTNTKVIELIIKNKKVIGVKVEQNGDKFIITSKQEVILSAGAIDSPRLLLVSGIGDEDELNDLGIKCHKHLPGVGKNLQDHLDCMITTCCKNSIGIGISWRSIIPHIFMAPIKYIFKHKGWLTTNYVEVGGFAKTKYAKENVDIQFHFTPIYRSHRGKKFEFGHGYSLFTCLLRPKSRGTIKLKNDGNKNNILIDHNFFAAKEDQEIMLDAIKKARQILSSSAFAKIRGKEMAPGEKIQTDTQIMDYLRATTATVYHPVGTCKMGIDKMAVVDPKTLKVYGIAGLRVIDASIMPTITSDNTSAPTMMIADKGAQMILAGS